MYLLFFPFLDSAFKQQRLPAWQPILTAGTVLPAFFVIGFAFLPIGIGMFYFSDNVQELKRDYQDCKQLGTDLPCDDVVQNVTDSCKCQEEFTLSEDWEVRSTSKVVKNIYNLSLFF